MTSNTEIMTMNNATNNSNATNSTDNKSNNESYSSLQSKFAVHVRQDKRKKFFTRATSAKITVKEFFDFIKTAYQVCINYYFIPGGKIFEEIIRLGTLKKSKELGITLNFST